MTELLTAAQMRAIEMAAIGSGAVTGLELMERAGQGVVEAILEWRPALAQAPHKAVVLCGPGNNGGDGFVIARLLHQRGWEAEVYLFGNEAKLPPDAASNCARWRELGPVAPIGRIETQGYPDAGDGVALVIDALFGSGLARPFLALGPLQMHLNYLQAACGTTDGLAAVVAVDVPSGLSSDTGHYPGYEGENPLDTCILANLTVTFHQAFVGHHLAMGPAACGVLAIKDIGVQGQAAGSPTVRLTGLAGEGENMVAGPRRAARKGSTGHKYTHGHALVLSGPPGRTGAARLAARGALRVGAGLVTVGCAAAAIPEHAARQEAIMLREVQDAAALTDTLSDPRLNALCLGPGLGLEPASRALVLAALAARRATVLDADALTVFGKDPETLFAALHRGCVLTPHAGEFARLFPDLAADHDAGAASKVEATRQAARRAGCVVLFKGPDTVIADPAGGVAINSAHYDRAAPWLATAGSGDVLAGFITGLMARGFAPMSAAETAAWLHVECALSFGPGLIAEDLPETLPRVFRRLGG